MKNSGPSERFQAFARRFVREYWAEVASVPPDLPGAEPTDRSLEELLDEIEYDVDREAEDRYRIRMSNGHGDEWRFTFRITRAGWTAIAASSASGPDGKRLDWFGPIYTAYFSPLLERVTRRAR